MPTITSSTQALLLLLLFVGHAPTCSQGIVNREFGAATGGPADEGCRCPGRGGDEFARWLTCIGLTEDEHERIVEEGWAASDLTQMSLEDAVSALRVSRAKAWRISRCGKSQTGDITSATEDIDLVDHNMSGPSGGEVAFGMKTSEMDSKPDCQINLYGGLYFPNYYFTLVADMPAHCGCSFTMRKYPTTPDEDILPNSGM